MNKAANDKTAFAVETNVARRQFASATFPLEVAQMAEDLRKLVHLRETGHTLTPEAEEAARELEKRIALHFLRKFGTEIVRGVFHEITT